MGSDLGTCSAALAPVTGIIVGSLTSGGCAPYKWDREGRWIVHEYAQARPVTKLWQYDGGLIGGEDLKAGDVNCRYDVKLQVEAEDRCEALTSRYDITREKLFLLNPVLRGDCSNIKYNTPYCTEGFIEPLRAYDGRCGPNHKNATCRGVDFGQCCNSETWTCGQKEYDCSPGVCYEGLCWGHKYYTTDGKCGKQHGDSKCAGKWGDCCSIDGQCGTGPEFCAESKCYSGNCEVESPSAEDAGEN